MSDFGKIYESSWWGEGVCANTIDWGSSYKSISNCSDASFSYAEASYAKDASDPTPTITGDAGGTFTATPAGLTINSSTGEVTLSTSTINSYTVKYTLSDGTFTTQTLGITAASFTNTFSMNYDGVDDYVYFTNEYFAPTVLNASNGNPTGSISFWFKLNVDSQNEYLMGFNTKFAAGGYTRFNFKSSAAWGGSGTYLRVWTSGADTDGGGGGENSCDFALYDQTYTTYGTSSVDWQKDTWYHCALVFDKDATNRYTLYLNGVAYPVPNTVGSSNGLRTITGTVAYSLPYTTGASTAGNQCIIGAYYTNFASGVIYGAITANVDELSLYSSALTPTNVTSIFNGGVPNDVSGLNPITWYRMGDGATWNGSKWTFTDEGSGGIDAESANMIEADRELDTP